MLLLRVSCNFAIFRQLLLQVQFCLLTLFTNGLLTRAFVCRARSQIFLRGISLRGGTSQIFLIFD
jgi:hypothetical protein